MPRAFALFCGLSAIAALAPSCLPNDTRPPPSTLNLTVSGSPLVTAGIDATSFDDGWSVSFQRVLASLGNPSVDGDSCTDYAETDYRRLYDASVVQPQKLALIYGLGTCNFNFRFQGPNMDSIEMLGVTDDDKTAVITPVQDADRYTLHDVSGITLWVIGSATNAATSTTKTFDWRFRVRRVKIHDCKSADGTYLSLDMPGNTTLALDIEIHPEVLFQDRLDWMGAHLRFTPFAQADDKFGNADGVVTLDELHAMTLADAGVTAADESADNDAGFDDSGSSVPVASPQGWTTFEDFVYLGLYPRVPRVAGYNCASDAFVKFDD